MKKLFRRSAHAVAAIFVGAGALLGAAPAHAGTPVPSDTSATGYVGLCNQQGKTVTSGSVYAKPFVWRALSSSPAPAPFNRGGRKATLYVYQPRPGTPPELWSGEPMTAASAYTDPSVPIAAATDRDEALSDYLNDFPGMVDGIFELRVVYTAVDAGASTAYAASFIQVTGTTWHVVKGGSVNCQSGKSVSDELPFANYDKSGLGPPQLLSVVAARSVGAPTSKAANIAARDEALGKTVPAAVASAAATATAAAEPSLGTGAGSTAIPGSTTAADSSSSSGGSHTGLVAALVLGLAVIGGAGYWWLRSRPVTGTGKHST